MTAGVLVDSNVLIDLSLPGSEQHRWAVERIRELSITRSARINPLIYAEVASVFESIGDLNRFPPEEEFVREPLPWEAALPTSRAFLRYRRGGGTRTSPLPDFYIGAHAEAAGHRLLTRDVQRFRTYFPRVELIHPG